MDFKKQNRAHTYQKRKRKEEKRKKENFLHSHFDE